MSHKRKSSIEETIELWAKEQLKGIKFYPKTDFINPQIEKALKTEPSNRAIPIFFRKGNVGKGRD